MSDLTGIFKKCMEWVVLLYLAMFNETKFNHFSLIGIAPPLYNYTIRSIWMDKLHTNA